MHENEASHRAILAAFAVGDLAAAAGYYSDDVVFHLNGRGPVAGDHHGFSGFVEAFSKVMGAVDSYRQEVHDVIASERHSVGLLTSVATRGEEALTSEIVTVLTWRDGKVVDERIIAVDPYVADAFYQ